MSEPSQAPARNNAGAFYRVCRMLHGYLSAAAFLALLFFAGTGVLLNHPEWMPPRGSPQEVEGFTLDHATLTQARALDAESQAGALAAAVTARSQVLGAFTSGDIMGAEAYLRFEGVRGASTATVDLSTGAVELEIDRADALSILNDLHRGKNAGAAWKLIIDIVGALTIALSLIGFVIFFSLRFRLVTSLALVAGGAAALVGVYVLFVS